MDVPAGFVRPFRCFFGAILDANHNMAADFGVDHNTFRPRGWGRISYLPNADDVMDQWVEWALARAEGLNDPEEIVEAMNNLNWEGPV